MKKIISIIFIFIALLSISPKLSFALPPNIPTITSISPAPSVVGIQYSINFTTTDPENNLVYYQFDWNTDGVWDQRYPLVGTVPGGGAPQAVTRTWTVPGDNSFNIRAVDSGGLASNTFTKILNLIASNPTNPAITGPNGTLYTGISYNFTFSSTDPNNRQIQYTVEYDSAGMSTNFPFFGYVNSGTSFTSSKSFATPGQHHIRVRARNDNGDYSNWAYLYFDIVSPNSAPNQPDVTTDAFGTVNVIHNFDFRSSDPDGDNIKYEIDWNNDGSVDVTVPPAGYEPSGTLKSTNISWANTGTYVVNVRAVDINGNASLWRSRAVTVNPVTVPAPSRPEVLISPAPTRLNTSYPINFRSLTPDGEDVFYEFDWNMDGTWETRYPLAGYVTAGVTQRTINHTWTTAGNNTFNARAIDRDGDSSPLAIFIVNISAPPTLTLTATPATIPIGGSATPTLTWSSTDTASCTASGDWTGAKALSDSQTMPVQSTSKVYTLTCIGTDGSSVSKTATVNVAVKLIGWAWSSNIGWISFNSLNPTAGAGASYAVTVATTSTLGTFAGYAWSSNIGWISFGAGDASHPNPTVDLTTGRVSGWARACSATVNSDCTGAEKPGGWDGWISLSGTNHESPVLNGSMGVTLNPLTGKFNGHSWGSEVVGWLTFDSALANTPPVTCLPCIVSSTLNPKCTIQNTLINNNQTQISWTKFDMDASTICTLDGSSLQPVTKTLNLGWNTFRVNCNKNGAPVVSCTTNINNIPPVIPNVDGQMWVEDDNVEKKKTTSVIRIGNPAIVNWYLGTHNNCVGIVRSVVPATLAHPSGWFIKGSIRAEISGLERGIYNLGISCENNAYNTNDVRIIVRDSNIEEI